MAVKQFGNDSAFKRFLKANKSLAFMLPLLVILVVVLIILYSGSGDEPVSSEVPTPGSTHAQTSIPSINDQTQVEVLPKIIRASETDDDAVVQDPFTSPMRLTGVLLYPDYEKTKAIIEYGGVSYIVKRNEAIGNTAWTVEEIFQTSVMLDSDGKSQLLELDKDSYGMLTSAEYITDDAETVTIHLANADIRDVISAIVLDLGFNAVYLNDRVIVDRFEAENIPPEEALSLLLKTVDMDYIQDGNTMIVGYKERLTTVFFDSMVLTRFSLKYVDANVISNQITNLGIPVQKITLDSNPYAIWIQGSPRELGKVRELIAMLDNAENMSGSIGASKLVSIQFTYMTAHQMNAVLREVGLQTGLVLESNPKILYVYANDSQVAQIQELKAKLDTADNQQLDFAISMKKLTYIRASEIVPIIYQFGLGVDVITFSRTAMAVWLKGDEEAVKQVSSLIDQIDIKQNIDADHFIIRKLNNITALEADYRLSLLGIPEIQTYTFSYPQFSKSILVVCPEDYKIYVTDHLNQMDVMADKIKVPIDYSDDPAATFRLEMRRELLSQLTGIPESSFTISKNVSRDNNPYYLLILEETPERIKMVEDMIQKIDNPLSNQYEPGY